MGVGLVRRATIVELEGHRNRSLDLYARAFDLLEEARAAAISASPSAKDSAVLNDAARDALAPRWGGYHTSERREKFLDAMRRQVDGAVWHHLIQSTELEKLMDKKARDQFREQLDKDPPPATADNCFATLQSLMGDAEMIFRRGIAEAFSNLDRRFRTHDGFKIGSHIVLSSAFNEHGSWSHWRNHDETLRDVERTFCVLDEKPMPQRMGGIIGAIDSAKPGGFGPRAYVGENEYFRVRVYKNGNAHVWFKRNGLVQKVNRLLGEYYGDVIGVRPDAAEVRPEFNRMPAKNFGFYETQPDTANRVLDDFSLCRGMTVLEPSAGRGALARAAAAKGCAVTCVEIQPPHVAHLREQGLYERVVAGDFFDLVPEGLGTFDRIIMNPPFDGQRDIDHVTHAVRFLKPGGRLVAIMAAGTEFRENPKAVAFRRLVEVMRGSFRDLPPGSFKESGTMVNTVVVTLHARKA